MTGERLRLAARVLGTLLVCAAFGAAADLIRFEDNQEAMGTTFTQFSFLQGLDSDVKVRDEVAV